MRRVPGAGLGARRDGAAHARQRHDAQHFVGSSGFRRSGDFWRSHVACEDRALRSAAGKRRQLNAPLPGQTPRQR